MGRIKSSKKPRKPLSRKKVIIFLIIGVSVVFLVGGAFAVFFWQRSRNAGDEIIEQPDNEPNGVPDEVVPDEVIPPDTVTPPPPDQGGPPRTIPTPYNITEPFFVRGVLVVNKRHPLPRNFAPGNDPTAMAAFLNFVASAQRAGVNVVSHNFSGFRSYDEQRVLFNNFAAAHGVAAAETFSARPGFSEHQTGLAFDLIDNTGQLYRINDPTYDWRTDWVYQNAHRYGFIVRYRGDWQHITGFIEEPWHLRFLGVDLAGRVFRSGLPLESYLGFPGGDYIHPR